MTEHRPLRLYQRSESVDALGRMLVGLQAGGTGALFLYGEAGTGKSTLLEEASRLAGPDVRLATARGETGESDLPFGFASQLFESLGHAGLTSSLPLRAAASDIHGVVLARANNWLQQAAAVGPLLVLLDDVHWADPDSLALLAFLGQRLDGYPASLVATARPWPNHFLVERLASECGGDVVNLAPLTPDAVEGLLTDLLGARPSVEHSARAWELSGGNPFLVSQVAAIITSKGDLPRIERLDLGQRRRLFLLSRLSALPEAVLRCAQAAAVLGDRFQPALMAPLLGISRQPATDALAVLSEAGVVREADPGWAAFVHPLMRLAVYEDLAPARRAIMHARAFKVLADRGELLPAAGHAVAADLVGDIRAIDIVRAAADAALASGAVRSGIDQLRAAMTLAGGASPSSWHIDLADALLAAGEPQEAAAACRKGLADVGMNASQRAWALQLLARALVYSGDLEPSARVSGEALALAGEASPSSVASALVDRVHLLWQLGGPRRALALLCEVDGLDALEAIDPTLEAAHCFIRFCAAPEPTVIARLAALVQRVTDGQANTQSSPFDPMLVYMSVARYAELFDEDDRVYELAYARAVDSGVLHALVPLLVSRADNRIRRGRPMEALAILDEAQRNATVEPIMAEAVAFAQALALAELGRIEESSDRAPALGPASFMWMVRVSALSLRSRLLFGRGQIDESCESYLELERVTRELGINALPAGAPWVGHAMEAYLTGRRLEEAARLCEWLDGADADLTWQWPRKVALGGRAAIAAAEGEFQAADALYTRAVALPFPLELERARLLLRYGAWLRRSNKPYRARPLIAEALAVAERAGARDLAERAEAELRVAGGAGRPARPSGNQLTAQEQRVANLAIPGLTTREIAEQLAISPKTVESHLTHIFDKLGARNRRDLRDRPFPDPASPN